VNLLGADKNNKVHKKCCSFKNKETTTQITLQHSVMCRWWCADDDYIKFVAKLENVEPMVVPTPESFLEEIEAREKQMKGDRRHVYLLTHLFIS